MKLGKMEKEIWKKVYAELEREYTPEAIVQAELNNNSIMDRITDGCAIVMPSMTAIWVNERFMRDFPNSIAEMNAEKNCRKNILSIMEHPAFSHMDENKNENENKNPNPFSEFLTTFQSAKSLMTCKGNRIFEVEVHPWKHPLLEEICMLFVVHDATKRQELKNQLSNIHEMCDSLSHIDNLREYSPEERWEFLKSGIMYIVKDMLHYEYLELRLHDPETDSLELFTFYGLEKEAIQRTPRVEKTKNGTIGYVAATQQTYICKDTETDPHYLVGASDARSSMTVPILFQGELKGILNIESSNPSAFDEQDKLYGEILAHEIANAINIFTLLDSEKAAGIQTSVEEIHSVIALPCHTIEEKTIELFSFLRDDQLLAKHALCQIIYSSQAIRKVIFQVGQQLAPQIINADYQAIANQYGETFKGKQILLLGTSETEQRDAQDFFTYLGCDFHCAQTGEEALAKMQIARQNGSDYYAILCVLKPEGYVCGTQFFIDLARVYGKEHPPLVVLQELIAYDSDHTFVNVRLRYPAATRASYPFINPDGNFFEVLLQRILAAVQGASETKPNFMKYSDYDDPYGEEK